MQIGFDNIGVIVGTNTKGKLTKWSISAFEVNIDLLL